MKPPPSTSLADFPPPRSVSERAAAALEAPEHIPILDAAGDFAGFMWRAVRGFRWISSYAGEVLRQTALIASGSTLVIVAIAFMTGATCGIEGSAIGRALGSGIVAPLFSAFCTTREVVPFIFGFIVAAKIGGGMVAQLGSMQVNEEVDAMDVMGVPSITFLVSTRLMAALLLMPIIYFLSLAAGQGAAWLTSFVRSGDVSQGTWESVFYNAIARPDLLYSLTKGIVISVAVISTALYFGYRVRGGPVEVGVATARSMAVNLILVTVLNMVMTFIFWGFNPNLPIA